MKDTEFDFEHLNLDEIKDLIETSSKKVIHDCFKNLKIVKKNISNKNGKDSSIYFHQCQICGCQKHKNLKYLDAFELNNCEELPLFNDEVESFYTHNLKIYNELKRNLHLKTRTEDDELKEWIFEHERFLKKSKCDLLLTSLKEFKKNTDNDLTTLNIINTFLKEEYPTLEEHKCISNLFNNPEYKNKEEILKDWFSQKFKKFFILLPNVWGKCEYSNSKVEIDYVARLTPEAKQYILKNIPNFIDVDYFGIEVKFFDVNSNSHKLSEAYAQCIDYSFSKFTINNQNIKLPFIILLSNLSFDKEHHRYQQNYHTTYRFINFLDGQKKLARKFNIGEFKFETEKNDFKLKNWAIKFLDQNYLRYTYSDKKIMQSQNLSIDRKCGNRSI